MEMNIAFNVPPRVGQVLDAWVQRLPETIRWNEGLALIRCLAGTSPIRLAVFVNELPFAFYKQGLEVVIGIASFTATGSVFSDMKPREIN